MIGEGDKVDRYSRGWEKLKEIDGEAGEAVVESLKDIAPDLARYIIEFSFGDIYSRTGTSLPEKEIAVVAALTAMGNAAPQLKVHIHGALNVGVSTEELVEVILQMSSYSGFPSAINGINTLKDVLQEMGVEFQPVLQEGEGDRFARGKEWLGILDENQVQVLEENFRDVAPDLTEFVVSFGYGDIYSRKNLDPKMRQIATIAALTAMGTAQPQLAFHIRAGLKVGLSREEIVETIILMVVYAGFPAAINGINTAKEVFNSL
ncbi:carboxymuconolactone decarboxylase family protein [Methanobacterium formicicum]|uniref:Carboxymuconolactone decarboxylase n=1 Tax=Methanobacterium formicicum TaxID=2162 RepID=A0A089ZG83_METFO|nr:carboxymuconolactone decarboxylase family protein [Methanobacterium formicicum]AIS31083.1 carboxymuconolactone decarboxylase family protein [Methanobacterium formicicum]CEL25757.1 carboxymuconolactone decarboxylase [Methanobacterium formicicum]